MHEIEVALDQLLPEFNALLLVLEEIDPETINANIPLKRQYQQAVSLRKHLLKLFANYENLRYLLTGLGECD
jgi:hypothetical protein